MNNDMIQIILIGIVCFSGLLILIARYIKAKSDGTLTEERKNNLLHQLRVNAATNLSFSLELLKDKEGLTEDEFNLKLRSLAIDAINDAINNIDESMLLEEEKILLKNVSTHLIDEVLNTEKIQNQLKRMNE